MSCLIVVARTAATPAVAIVYSILQSSVMMACSMAIRSFPLAISNAAGLPTARRITPILLRPLICHCSPVSTLIRSQVRWRVPFPPSPPRALQPARQVLRHLLRWQQAQLRVGHGSAAGEHRYKKTLARRFIFCLLIKSKALFESRNGGYSTW